MKNILKKNPYHYSNEELDKIKEIDEILNKKCLSNEIFKPYWVKIV